MLALLLASALSATPIQDSAQKIIQDFPNCAPSASDSEKIKCLEAGLIQVKQVADDTSTCVRDSFILAGGDLMTSAVAWKNCPECGEANPLGFNTESRVALKFVNVGVQIATCYETAKGGHKPAKVARWTLRGINMLVIINNLIAAITGKPFINWGGQEPAVAP